MPNSHSKSLDGLDEALANKDLMPEASWGLAVDRIAYGDYAAWRCIPDAPETSAIEAVALRDRSNLLQRHKLVNFDDLTTLNGALPHDMHTRFNMWAVEELRRNWGIEAPAPDEEHSRSVDPD